MLKVNILWLPDHQETQREKDGSRGVSFDETPPQCVSRRLSPSDDQNIIKFGYEVKFDKCVLQSVYCEELRACLGIELIIPPRKPPETRRDLL